MAKEETRQLFNELSKRLKELPDSDYYDLFSMDQIKSFLNSILNTEEKDSYQSIAEFFLKNKHRSVLIAYLYHMIFRTHSLSATKNGKIGYVSPMVPQFEEGILLVEGTTPWSGFPIWYKDGELKYGISKRDYRVGDSVDPRDFDFIPVQDFKDLLAAQIKEPENIEQPIKELTKLLKNESKREEDYQQFFTKYPWFFGVNYKKIQDLRRFDDKNIPDFTGVRAHDQYRDIIEIKQPFMRLFKRANKLNAKFNDSWNQAERYLLFARENQDYLKREKGLAFSNPKCILIAGYNLTEEQQKRINEKQRLVGNITFYTYDNILAIAKNMITLSKDISK